MQQTVKIIEELYYSVEQGSVWKDNRTQNKKPTGEDYPNQQVWIQNKQRDIGYNIHDKTAQWKVIRDSGNVHLCFRDIDKAFDRITREHIWGVLKMRGISQSIIGRIQSLYENRKNYVKTRHKNSKC